MLAYGKTCMLVSLTRRTQAINQKGTGSLHGKLFAQVQCDVGWIKEISTLFRTAARHTAIWKCAVGGEEEIACRAEA
jgi:hypothetical protein